MAKIVGYLATEKRGGGGWEKFVTEGKGEGEMGVRRPRRKQGGAGAGVGGFDWMGLGVDGVVLWLCVLE